MDRRENITDEMIEAGARAAYETRLKNVAHPDAFPHWDDFVMQDLYRDEARAALEAALGAQEPALDELLDSLPPQTRIKHFPYYRMDHDGEYHCKIVVPLKSRAISGGFAPYYGAGATRMEAIRAAVKAATNDN